MGRGKGSKNKPGINSEADARRAREWLMRSVHRALDLKLGQIMEFMVKTLDAEHAKTQSENEMLRAALQKVADLVDSEAGEPLDDAIDIANSALATGKQL